MRDKLLLLALAAASFLAAACSSSPPTKHSDAAADGPSSTDAEDAGPTNDDADAPSADDSSNVGDGSVDDALDGASDLSADDGGDALVDGSGGEADGSMSDVQPPDASVDGGSDAPACPTCLLYPTYQLLNQSSGGGLGDFFATAVLRVTVVNGSSDRVPLTGLRFRYWFDPPVPGSVVGGCIGCPNTNSSAPQQGAPGVPGAQLFFEMAFQGGTLDAFSDTGPLVLQIERHSPTPVGFFGLRSDYSAWPDPSQPDPKIVILRGGTVVWGVPP
jgi:hypothetical protein